MNHLRVARKNLITLSTAINLLRYIVNLLALNGGHEVVAYLEITISLLEKLRDELEIMEKKSQ